VVNFVQVLLRVFIGAVNEKRSKARATLFGWNTTGTFVIKLLLENTLCLISILGDFLVASDGPRREYLGLFLAPLLPRVILLLAIIFTLSLLQTASQKLGIYHIWQLSNTLKLIK